MARRPALVRRGSPNLAAGIDGNHPRALADITSVPAGDRQGGGEGEPGVVGIGVGLIVAVLKELGWTGFAMPRLRRRHSVLAARLLMGVLWGAWHLPMFAGSADSSGEIPPALFMATMLISWLLPYRVLMVWVSDRTHSLLVPVLMHIQIVIGQLVLNTEGDFRRAEIRLPHRLRRCALGCRGSGDTSQPWAPDPRTGRSREPRSDHSMTSAGAPRPSPRRLAGRAVPQTDLKPPASRPVEGL